MGFSSPKIYERKVRRSQHCKLPWHHLFYDTIIYINLSRGKSKKHISVYSNTCIIHAYNIYNIRLDRESLIHYVHSKYPFKISPFKTQVKHGRNFFSHPSVQRSCEWSNGRMWCCFRYHTFGCRCCCSSSMIGNVSLRSAVHNYRCRDFRNDDLKCHPNEKSWFILMAREISILRNAHL